MHKILIPLLLILSSVRAFAMTEATINNVQFDLNRASPEMLRKHQLGTKFTKENFLLQICTYNFTTQGGAVGAITLQNPITLQNCSLPKNAVIVGATIDNLTAVTAGAGATVTVGTGQSTTDIKNLTAASSYTGLLSAVPVFTAATAIKLTADATPAIAVGSAALTAGKFNVLFYYVMSQ